jgi:hypothetical protein
MVVENQKTIEMLWKQFCISYEPAALGEMFQNIFVLGKQLTTALTVEQKKACGMIFFCSTRRS